MTCEYATGQGAHTRDRRAGAGAHTRDRPDGAGAHTRDRPDGAGAHTRDRPDAAGAHLTLIHFSETTKTYKKTDGVFSLRKKMNDLRALGTYLGPPMYIKTKSA